MMIGRLLVPLLSLLAVQAAHAQGTERRGFIGLGIGPSVPFGAFADGRERPGAGGARPGYTSTLVNVARRGRGSLGVAGTWSYSEYFMRDTADDDWWQVVFLAIGPMYSRPLGARTVLDVKAMVGLAVLTPVIDNMAGTSDIGNGLALDVRTTLSYDLFPRLAVFAEGGVQTTQANTGGGGQRYAAVISGLGIAYRPAWR